MIMKRLLITLFVVASLYGCQKDQLASTIPDCIVEIIENNQAGLAVVRMRLNHEFVYHMHTGFAWIDGPEFILNSSCDTVCFLGGYFPVNNCGGNLTVVDTVWKR